VWAVNNKRVFAVGLNGIILHTEDGGKNWRRDLTGTTTPLRAVAFHEDNGWAVGRDGAILRFAGLGPEGFRTVFGRK
jgi:photosystem II stability/assembly factor-like uncharacterized protein